MDNRKLLANASATPPTPPASPSVGYPTNGGVGVPAGTGGAYWFHSIAEEIRNVIVAAGLTPSDANLSQLLAALSAGWGMAKNLASPGYITFPGGLIAQWGISSVIAANTAFDQTLPIAYPTIHLCAWLTFIDTATFRNTPQVGQLRGATTDLTVLKMGNTSSVANQFNWLSIGK